MDSAPAPSTEQPAQPVVPKGSPLPIAFPLGFMGIGALVGTIGYVMVSRARRSRSWPSVEGTVTASDVTWTERMEHGDGIRIGRRPRDHHVRIEYAYSVDDNTHRGTKYSFADAMSKSEGMCRKIVERHPVGSKVEVFYDPKDPTKAVLDRSTGCGPWMFFVVGGGFFAMGLAMTYFMFIRR